MTKNYHVLPHGKGQWQVKGEGDRFACALAPTQAEAIGVGRDIASQSAIHK